jgi:hypothetical protein
MLVVFKDSKRGAELRETRSLVQVRLQVAGWLVPRSEWKKWRNPVTSRDLATSGLGIVAHLDRFLARSKFCSVINPPLSFRILHSTIRHYSCIQRTSRQPAVARFINIQPQIRYAC